MNQDIKRIYSQAHPTITSGGSLSTAVDMRQFCGGSFTTPATLDATTVIGFSVSNDGANYAPLYDKDNALVKVTVALDASRSYPLPDELFGAAFFKIFTCTTGAVAVNQTGDKTFQISLKG